MFLEIDLKDKSAVAMIDSEGCQVSYGEIINFAENMQQKVRKRTLVFVLSKNCVGAALGYLGAMINRIVPLMLNAGMDQELLKALIEIYCPSYIWKPIELVEESEEVLLQEYQYALVATGLNSFPMYEELSLLLTTSGSTGSPKLVRHSYQNLEVQARNISAFFELDGGERPMIDLPINYTYGLSVLNSHLYSGATALLTSMNILSPQYWNFLKENKATSFTNVPYAYEILKKLRVFRMDLPYLKIFSQGGGKLNEELHREFAQYALDTGRKFIVTYGQTEGSARMAWLPSEYALKKCGSIGKAIPNGKLYIVNDNGEKIYDADVVGELVYEGPNVTLGYAQSGEDLQLGDERRGVLFTGDLAKKDSEGFFYIVGRKKRFIKLNGLRIGLDECENLISCKFGIECACVGDDKRMIIYIVRGTSDDNLPEMVINFVSNKMGINSHFFSVKSVFEIIRNEAGKIMYTKLEECE